MEDIYRILILSNTRWMDGQNQMDKEINKMMIKWQNDKMNIQFSHNESVKGP